MRKCAAVFVFLAGVLWGTMGIFVRRYNGCGLDSWDIVFIRAAATSLCMSLFLLFYNRSLFRIRLRDVWCFLGTGVYGDSAALNAGGIVTGLGAGLGYALYSVFSRFALEKGYHAFTISFYTFLIAAAGTLPMADISRTAGVCLDNVFMIVFSIIFGLVSTVLPYVLYTVGMRSIENGNASIIASVEPVVATLLGVVLYGESITPGGLAGVVLILCAIVLSNIRRK